MTGTSDIVIRTEGLGKRFKLGEIQAYKALRDTITDAVKAPLVRLGAMLRGEPRTPRHHREFLWALKDVSVDIRAGEAVGIVGGNGAGKSTFLKVLSRITEPTEGEAEIRGRVGSLLEVGTGFHPELTGRENIFLNGAILGMSKVEILAKFDEIVAFSGVAKFIDTPVKHYSSGMYMRLAFSVAAHLEPEILMVDEVLAVGDAAFQRKCLGKMNEVAGAGRTVLFVSHNMAQIRRLCPRVIWLSGGKVREDGPGNEVVDHYLTKDESGQLPRRAYEVADAPGDDTVRLRTVSVNGPSGEATGRYNMDDTLEVRCECEILKSLDNFHVMLSVHSQEGVLVFCSASFDHYGFDRDLHFEPGRHLFRCAVPAHFLNRGLFSASLSGQIPGVRFVFREERVVTFEITELGGAGGPKSSRRPGICRPALEWEIDRTKPE